MLDTYKATIRHLLSICFTDETCMRNFMKENFNPDIFQDYKDFYLKIRKNYEELGVFNAELFFLDIKYDEEFTNLTWKLLETKSSVYTFNKLMKVFKHEAFKSELDTNINTAKMLLSTNNPEDTKKAYAMLHRDIELNKEAEENDNSLESLVNNYSTEKKRQFLNLGFHALDFVKVERTDLVIIGARPSLGKSAFLFNLIRSMKIKSTLISLEMGKEPIFDRFMAMYSGGVPMDRIRERKFSDKDKVKIDQALEKVKKIDCNIIDDCGFEINTISQIIRKEVKKGSKAIYIDYLQLIRGNGKSQNRNLEIGEISVELKSLCKELKVPIFLLSQLGRQVEQRADKRPNMSDLRDSGNLEQDADIIMLLYRDSYYYAHKADDTTFEVIVGKQRQGECKTAYLDYLRAFQVIQSREK